MAYFFTLIPFALMIIILLLLDSFSLVKWSRLFLSALWGVISAALCLLLYSFITPGEASETFVTPVIEEIFKGLFLIYLFTTKKVFFLIDAIVYGVAIGGGFGLLENIFYILSNPGIDINELLFTILSTATIHIGATALLGALMHTAVTSKKNVPLRYIFAFICAIAFHIIFNLINLPQHFLLVISLFAMVLIMTLVIVYDKKNIDHWIESSMAEQVSLLNSIKKNQLIIVNNTDRYVHHALNDFRSDRTDQIVRYITLFLELSIAAKGNMLLCEAGMEVPKDPENQKKIRELYALRKSIGKTGELATNSLVRFDNVEKWIIDSLL